MSKPKPKSGIAGVSYRDDGDERWEVRVRWTAKGKKYHLQTVRYPVDPKAKAGEPTHIATARRDAEAYAPRERAAIKAHGKPYSLQADAWTLRALLERYLEDIDKGLIAHKAVRTEKSGCRMLLGLGKGTNAKGFPHLVDLWVGDLTYEHFVGDGSDSLQSLLLDRDGNKASGSSLKRLLTVIRGVFIRAQTKWGIELKNPLQSIKGIEVSDSRERIITPEEWEKVAAELAKHEQGTYDAIVFGRYTAARRSEVVKLDWSDINLDDKTARLRETKSRTNKVVSRTIPLPAAALAVIVRRAQPPTAKKPLSIRSLAKHARIGPVFTTNKSTRIRADTLTQAWTRACERAGVEGARVHDLRHTRITELGRFLSAAEAARVSGHTDLATFFRYFNPDPVETGKKIDAMENDQRAANKGIRHASNALAALSNDEFAAAIAAAIQARSKNSAGK